MHDTNFGVGRNRARVIVQDVLGVDTLAMIEPPVLHDPPLLVNLRNDPREWNNIAARRHDARADHALRRKAARLGGRSTCAQRGASL